MYYILTYHFLITASEVLLVVASSVEQNQKWMNKQFKNDYHRRVKEASTQLHYYNSNAPDPDQSWPECFWKCSFPFDLSKHNTRARNRGFIAHVKKFKNENPTVSELFRNSGILLTIWSSWVKFNTCSPPGQKWGRVVESAAILPFSAQDAVLRTSILSRSWMNFMHRKPNMELDQSLFQD